MRILRDNNNSSNLSEGLHAAEKDLIWNLAISMMLCWVMSLASSTAFLKPVTGAGKTRASQAKIQKPDFVIRVNAAGKILTGAEKDEKTMESLDVGLQKLSADKKDATVLVAAEAGAPAGGVFAVLSSCERVGLHPRFQLYQP